MASVIRLENLSKKYRIPLARPILPTFRETVTEKTKSFSHRLIHPREKQKMQQSMEEFWALKNVSFEIKQGDRVSIMGYNGAGKSTLLKILSRITEPTSGRAVVRGRVASLMEVGTGFHPELSGRENIFLNGAVLGMGRTEIRKKMEEIVAFAEVEHFIDTPVKHYSSGMSVRLAFSVAAHLKPDVLIVDEVLAVGDAAFQKKCLDKMRESCDDGRTIVLVSHQISILQNLCQTGIVLEKGELVYCGEQSNAVLHYEALDRKFS